MADSILNRNPEEDDVRTATDEQLAFIDLTNEQKSFTCFTCGVEEAAWCREMGTRCNCPLRSEAGELT
jgi:hypothetical protein